MFGDETGAIDTEEGESWTPPADYPAADPMQGMGTGDESGQPAIPVPGSEAGGDNSGQPAIPAPNMGGQTAAPAQGSPDWTSEGSDQSQPPMGRGIKSIVSYLMGADAMPPGAVDGAGKTVDPQGQLTQSQRNVLAIQHARENGGDEAAWALMASNMQEYNAKTSVAKAALEGTAQKPPSLMYAIDAANKAQANVLDGSNVEFKPVPGGPAITATVTGPDGGAPQQFVLSQQQFAKWLDVGGDGQWDKIMSTSAAGMLQKLAAEDAQPSPARGAQPPRGARGAQPSPAFAAPLPGQGQSDEATPSWANSETPRRKTTFGTDASPSTINLSGSDEVGPEIPDETAYDPKMKARAFQKFPGITQQADRNSYMDAQEQRDATLENAVLVAGETGKAKVRVAETAAGARVDAAGIHADAAKFKASQMGEAQKNKVMMELQRQERIAASTASRNAASLLRQKLANNLFDKMSPEENAQVASMIGAGQPGAAPAHAPQPQAAPAAQGGGSKKMYNGKLYTREEYERDVLGKR